MADAAAPTPDPTPKPTPAATPVPAPKAPAPRRMSPRVALINFDQCTGCEACITVAPHDTCIVRVSEHPLTSSVEVINDECTGCTLCMKICPWDAISMVPRPATT